MLEVLALIIVCLIGIYFIALAAVSLLKPALASDFLLGFAGSASKHYIELLLRFVAGGALVLHAPRMLFPGAFTIFGGILIVTTAVLFLIPWQWHHRFAQKAVPYAVRHLTLVAVASLVMGAFVLMSIIQGNAS